MKKLFAFLLAALISTASVPGDAQQYVSTPPSFGGGYFGYPYEAGVLLAVTALGTDMTVFSNTLKSVGCSLIKYQDLSFVRLVKIGVGGNTMANASYLLSQKGLVGMQPNWYAGWRQLSSGTTTTPNSGYGMPVGLNNDQYFPAQGAYLTAVNVPNAWSQMKSLGRTAPVRIAFLDSGFSNTADLLGKLAGGDYLGGASYLNDDVSPKGHGTMLASIPVAQPNNKILFAGVNPYASAFGINISRGSGLGTDDWNILIGLDTMMTLAPDCKICVIGAAPASGTWSLLNHPLVHAMLSTFYCRNGLVFAPASHENRNLGDVAVKDRTLILVGSVYNDLKVKMATNYGPPVWFYEPGQQILSMDRYGGLFYLTGTSASCAIGAGIASLGQSFRGGNTLLNATLITAIENDANTHQGVVDARRLIDMLR